MLGRTREQLIGWPVFQAFPPAPPGADAVRTALEVGQVLAWCRAQDLPWVRLAVYMAVSAWRSSCSGVSVSVGARLIPMLAPTVLGGAAGC